MKIIVNEPLHILPFEDYSDRLVRVSEGVYAWENCRNNSLICESTFKRLIDLLQNDTYAILSAYRDEFDKRQNILRNRKLRGVLNAHNMGVYQLVGHWREAPDGKKYSETPENELKDVVERSYVVRKPTDMSYKEFMGILRDCLTVDGKTQDCGIVHKAGDSWYLYDSDGNETFLGNHISFNKIGQAYSQWVRRLDVPFVFDYVEEPSSNSGRMLYTNNNIEYLK